MSVYYVLHCLYLRLLLLLLYLFLFLLCVSTILVNKRWSLRKTSKHLQLLVVAGRLDPLQAVDRTLDHRAGWQAPCSQLVFVRGQDELPADDGQRPSRSVSLGKHRRLSDHVRESTASATEKPERRRGRSGETCTTASTKTDFLGSWWHCCAASFASWTSCCSAAASRVLYMIWQQF